MYELLPGITRRKTQSEWIEGLAKLGVPCSPVNTVDQVFADPQVRHRAMQIRMPHPLSANGMVDLRVVVAGTPQAAIRTTNDSGWQVTHIDTAAYAGRVVSVKLVITSPAPYQRQFVVAAEARR